jgi:hypothetical protein
MGWSLVLVALALLGVAAVSGRLFASQVTLAILFVAFGLLVGPKLLGGIDLPSAGSTVRALAEATLALVLFWRRLAGCAGSWARPVERAAAGITRPRGAAGFLP